MVAKVLRQDVSTNRHPMITSAKHPPNTLNCIFSPSQFFLVAEMFSPSCFDASQGYSCAVKSPFQPQNRSDQLNTGKIFLNHIGTGHTCKYQDLKLQDGVGATFYKPGTGSSICNAIAPYRSVASYRDFVPKVTVLANMYLDFLFDILVQGLRPQI